MSHKGVMMNENEFHEHLKNHLSVLGVDPAKVDWLKVAQLIGELYRAFLNGSNSPPSS